MPGSATGQLAFDFPDCGTLLSPRRLRKLQDQGRDLLYFAVLPPADIAQRIAILAERLVETYAITGRKKSPELMHISLLERFIF